jgi:hypothetical protein
MFTSNGNNFKLFKAVFSGTATITVSIYNFDNAFTGAATNRIYGSFFK